MLLDTGDPRRPIEALTVGKLRQLLEEVGNDDLVVMYTGSICIADVKDATVWYNYTPVFHINHAFETLETYGKVEVVHSGETE